MLIFFLFVKNDLFEFKNFTLKYKKLQMKSYIGKRGYVMIKNKWDAEEISQVKEELTVKPFVNGDYGDNDSPFPVYLENSQKLYIPKYYGLKKFGKADKINISSGESINLDFNGDLRDHQREPIQKCLDAFQSTGGGILSLPCGDGKTACACYLISKLKKKTFVLVHKEFLMNQWIERILGGNDSHSFLPGARVGRIQGQVIDIEDKDIVIGMIQSISMKNYPLDLFDSFGFVILDESHRVPSREFSKALMKINCPYMLGLSATPNRKDGLTQVLKWYIGDIIYQRKGKSATDSVVERYVYDCADEAYSKEVTGYYGKMNSAAMINNIAGYLLRTKFIVRKTIECINDEQRQVLILSDRKELLKDLETFLKEEGIESGYYIGGMKQVCLEESAKKSVILATYQMAAEGLDISTIDTIILATPKTEIEQAVGRIRPKVGQTNRNTPLVIDIVDDFSIFGRQAQKRETFYKKKKYFIETFQITRYGELINKISTWDPEEDKPKKPKAKTGLISFAFANA